jgi:hypothetical protein
MMNTFAGEKSGTPAGDGNVGTETFPMFAGKNP